MTAQYREVKLDWPTYNVHSHLRSYVAYEDKFQTGEDGNL
jgi:hypothetical protein